MLERQQVAFQYQTAQVTLLGPEASCKPSSTRSRSSSACRRRLEVRLDDTVLQQFQLNDTQAGGHAEPRTTRCT